MATILQSVRSVSLRDIEFSDAVLILGEDLTNVAPVMALSVRQSVRQQPLAFADRGQSSSNVSDDLQARDKIEHGSEPDAHDLMIVDNEQ